MTREPFPKSLKMLWLRLASIWALAWLFGLILFSIVAIYFASRYFDQQIDSRLRIQAIAIYGLAYFDDRGGFRSDLLQYEDDLLDKQTKAWVVEPGEKPVFHLQETSEPLDHAHLEALAMAVVEQGEDIFQSGRDNTGKQYRLLAIPTYQGSSDVPIAAIIVCTDPSNATRAKWFFVTATLTSAALLGLLGVLVGGGLAQWSLAPLSKHILQREKFLSAAAHELRTPLASISAIIDSSECDEESAEMIHRLKPQIRKATTNMEDLLMFARLEADRMAVNLQPTRLDLLVEKCIPEDSTISTNLHETTVVCDHGLIEVAIQNLVRNALSRANSPEAVEITTSENTITVENNGGPIPDEVIAGLSHRAAILPSRTGGGFGLSIVQMIVDLHDAQLSICNQEQDLVSISIAFVADQYS